MACYDLVRYYERTTHNVEMTTTLSTVVWQVSSAGHVWLSLIVHRCRCCLLALRKQMRQRLELNLLASPTLSGLLLCCHLNSKNRRAAKLLTDCRQSLFIDQTYELDCLVILTPFYDGSANVVCRERELYFPQKLHVNK